ncbi:TrkH family potassium uptake protein [Candidatus Bathyarchaeota archaeon]|nr:MAG: TrkH family potassium uptake protein [Candidatus Bathyarchaeota archaeon]
MSDILVQLMPVVVAGLLGISILYSILSRRRAMKRYLYYSAFDPIFANLGFLFQFSGLLLVPPIIYAYYLQEFRGGAAISLSCATFLFLGLLLSLFFEPKMLDLKQSCVLFVLYYLCVPLIISIQFLYLGVFAGSFFDQLLNSWFEASSAISTTGFTLLEGGTLPKSLVLARAITEWNGGIGIIFLLLSSFYPGLALSQYGKALGIERLAEDYKFSFTMVLLVYAIYTIIFSTFLLFLGLDPFTAIHTVLAVYSTTGLTIVDVQTLHFSVQLVIAIMMIVSALSFSLHLKIFSILFSADWKSLLRGRLRRFTSSLLETSLRPVLTGETKLQIILIISFTAVYWLVTNLDLFSSFLHVLSSSASVGLNIINPDEMSEIGKIILIIAMLIGASSFSIGGGIRVYRLYILGKVLVKLPHIFLVGENPRIKINGRELEISEIMVHLAVFFLFAILTFLSSIFLCSFGYSLTDALFESASAISTTGNMTVEITQNAYSLHKLLLVVLMLLGRIEILPVFAILSGTAKPEQQG